MNLTEQAEANARLYRLADELSDWLTKKGLALTYDRYDATVILLTDGRNEVELA